MDENNSHRIMPRWKRRFKRRLKNLIRDILTLILIVTVLACVGAFVLSKIVTSSGQTLYTIVRENFTAELNNRENESFRDRIVSAARSAMYAVQNASIGDAETSLNTQTDNQTTTSSYKLKKSPNQWKEYDQGDYGIENTSASLPVTSAYGTFDDGYAQQVLSLVNIEREKEGLSPLSWNAAASTAAKIRSDEIVTQFSHDRPDSSKGTSALHEVGINWNRAGENLAGGQQSPESVVASWMDSELHRANILNPGYTSLGVACLYAPNSTYGYYWVQLFVG